MHWACSITAMVAEGSKSLILLGKFTVFTTPKKAAEYIPTPQSGASN